MRFKIQSYQVEFPTVGRMLLPSHDLMSPSCSSSNESYSQYDTTSYSHRLALLWTAGKHGKIVLSSGINVGTLCHLHLTYW